MKRCPECQFLYEDDSFTCDMDGTALRYTVKLPILPSLAKSIWDKWTIALLCLVIFGTLFVILYRATPRAYTSSAGKVEFAKQDQPATNEATQSSQSTPERTELVDADQSTDTSVDSSSDTQGNDPFASPSTRAAKAKRSSLPDNNEELMPAPIIHFEPARNPQPAAAPSTEPVAAKTSASQPAAAAVNSTPAHPKAPENYSNKPNTDSQKKDSGVKSFFKKAGKALKKPFGEN